MGRIMYKWITAEIELYKKNGPTVGRACPPKLYKNHYQSLHNSLLDEIHLCMIQTHMNKVYDQEDHVVVWLVVQVEQHFRNEVASFSDYIFFSLLNQFIWIVS